MLDPDHTPSEPIEEPGRGVSRGLIVGDYEGLRAGEAIVAVRTLGLRPSLERVEGYEDSLHGFVVSQEPACGAEVPADSQVFVYVAAPARAILGSPSGEREEELSTDAPSTGAGEDPPGFDESSAGELPAGEAIVDAYDPDDVGAADEDFAEEGVGDFTDDSLDEGAEEEPVEPVRVWRGPPPGAVSRRRLASPASPRRRSLLRSLPLGTQLAAIAVFVCVASALLLSLASQLHNGSPSPVATQSRPRTQAALSPSPVRTPAPAPTRAVAVHAPRRPSVRHHAIRSLRRVAVSTRVVALAPDVSTPSRGAPLTGAAADEHAAREFGP